MHGLFPLLDRVVLFLAQGLGAGRSQYAPGTIGTLISLPLVWLLSSVGRPVVVSFVIVFGLFSVLVAGRASRYLDREDDPSIVIDEIAGFLVAMALVPLTLWTLLAGFVIFRLLDIFKPPPIGLLERRIRGGAGIVADDVVAGIMTNIVLQVGVWWL